MFATPSSQTWAAGSFLATHNWWHLALFHLELDDHEQVIALYDQAIGGTGSSVVLDLIDASAMLWRLHLRGVDVGDRWQPLADHWTPLARAGIDNALFTREVGHPAALAVQAFGHGDFATAVVLLRGIRHQAHRFGGSHAQRDLIDLTLLEAALRGGDRALARGLAAERLALRPRSPLASRLARQTGHSTLV